MSFVHHVITVSCIQSHILVNFQQIIDFIRIFKQWSTFSLVMLSYLWKIVSRKTYIIFALTRLLRLLLNVTIAWKQRYRHHSYVMMQQLVKFHGLNFYCWWEIAERPQNTNPSIHSAWSAGPKPQCSRWWRTWVTWLSSWPDWCNVDIVSLAKSSYVNGQR